MKTTIGDILNAANEVTNKTVADVFVNYSGHIKQLKVFVYEDGWTDRSHAAHHKVCLEYELAQEKIDAIFIMLVDMLPAQPEGSGDEVGA